jgi:hypothetical protein
VDLVVHVEAVHLGVVASGSCHVISPLQSLDILGDFGQIVVELMSAAIELVDDCPRRFFFVERRCTYGTDPSSRLW